MGNTNIGKEVICVKLPEMAAGGRGLCVGMTGLTIVNEFADLYQLRNAKGEEGIYPKACFKLIDELDIVDYLDEAKFEMAEALFIAFKQGRSDLVERIEGIQNELSTLRADLLEERA